MNTPVIRRSTISLHYHVVERVINALTTQLDEPLSLAAMARIASTSPYYFNRTFRRVTGLPPFRFLYAMRLEAAKRMLLHTEKRVVDICYDVGYNSLGTFTRRFTDLLGVSPQGLRRIARRAKVSELNADNLPAKSRSSTSTGLHGCVTTPAGFHGLIFVGLFRSPILQGKPAACCFTTEAGLYCMENPPEGTFHLFSVGLRFPITADAYFDYSSALRGSGQMITISQGKVHGSTYVAMRSATPFDAPILLILPQLREHLQGKPGPFSSLPVRTPLGESA